jgi:hypothetical protein
VRRYEFLGSRYTSGIASAPQGRATRSTAHMRHDRRVLGAAAQQDKVPRRSFILGLGNSGPRVSVGFQRFRQNWAPGDLTKETVVWVPARMARARDSPVANRLGAAPTGGCAALNRTQPPRPFPLLGRDGTANPNF